MLGVDNLEVSEAGEPGDVVFGVGEGVAKGKKVRADDIFLQSQVGEEQSTVENLETQALVGVVVAQSAKEGTCMMSIGASKSSGKK